MKEKIVKYILVSAASTSIIIVFLIFLFLIKEAVPFIEDPGMSHLFKSKWNPVSFFNESFGLLPLITGSLLVTFMATIIAVPFGVIAAVYISEIAGSRERETLKPFIELLAGLPSVVLGFFGLIVLSPIIKELFHLDSGLSALTGAVILAMMAVPTIISVSEDAIRGVPLAYKQASMALGATKLQTIWRVIVPASLSGIIAAIMLGIGRVIGETMAVLMVTGNAPLVTLNPYESVRTMTATIAGEMGEVPFGSAHYSALFWVGIVLLLMTFCLVVISQKVLKKYSFEA
ncbi:MAG: phosphate ABC transporter permease subunit PstC [Fibrobacteria bacterium]|nr:phosphate ABC transporter permease subunit PstC [Fibrobacteria bacterium]